MLNRIRQLIEYSGLSSSQFADGIDVPRAILSHIMSGRNKPSLDVILKVAAKYTDVNLSWLLLGEGEMLKQIATETVLEPKENTLASPALTTTETTIYESHKPDKVQNIKPVEVDVPVVAADGKKVKQIVFFYTDNSFSVFNPEI